MLIRIRWKLFHCSGDFDWEKRDGDCCMRPAIWTNWMWQTSGRHVYRIDCGGGHCAEPNAFIIAAKSILTETENGMESIGHRPAPAAYVCNRGWTCLPYDLWRAHDELVGLDAIADAAISHALRAQHKFIEIIGHNQYGKSCVRARARPWYCQRNAGEKSGSVNRHVCNNLANHTYYTFSQSRTMRRRARRSALLWRTACWSYAAAICILYYVCECFVLQCACTSHHRRPLTYRCSLNISFYFMLSHHACNWLCIVCLCACRPCIFTIRLYSTLGEESTVEPAGARPNRLQLYVCISYIDAMHIVYDNEW